MQAVPQGMKLQIRVTVQMELYKRVIGQHAGDKRNSIMTVLDRVIIQLGLVMCKDNSDLMVDTLVKLVPFF